MTYAIYRWVAMVALVAWCLNAYTYTAAYNGGIYMLCIHWVWDSLYLATPKSRRVVLMHYDTYNIYIYI